MWWKTKTRAPFLCLPSTCQTTVATVTWAPCYCLPALLLPGVLFETKPSPSPLDGGDLTLHIKKRRRKARDPASCLICSHGGPLFCCIHCLKKSRHIWLWKYKFHHLLHSHTHTHIGKPPHLHPSSSQSPEEGAVVLFVPPFPQRVNTVLSLLLILTSLVSNLSFPTYVHDFPCSRAVICRRIAQINFFSVFALCSLQPINQSKLV